MGTKKSSPVLALYQRMTRWPLGHWLFSRAVCFRAPYFGSIRPRFLALRCGYAEARIRKRRAVQNHIGTVHAIAMANLCELVAGTMTEVTVPADMRWIPKGMTIQYLAKATTDVRAVAKIDPMPDFAGPMDVPVEVAVFDNNENKVVSATIAMYVSPRRSA
ncbi:MAG: DUF4442 domain-containing protein [Gammaproteobacteria bacterium]|nr:DUF4442 domain-containing protein [Gammaproteobacteria bacterium]